MIGRTIDRQEDNYDINIYIWIDRQMIKRRIDNQMNRFLDTFMKRQIHINKQTKKIDIRVFRQTDRNIHIKMNIQIDTWI